MRFKFVRAWIAQGMGDKLRAKCRATNANQQIVFKRTTLAADFPSVNFGGKILDPGGGFFDLPADCQRGRERGIPQPIMTDHAVFIGIRDGALFQRRHVGQRLLHARFHAREKLVGHVHAAQVHRQTNLGIFGVILLESLPPLQLCVVHKI